MGDKTSIHGTIRPCQSFPGRINTYVTIYGKLRAENNDIIYRNRCYSCTRIGRHTYFHILAVDTHDLSLLAIEFEYSFVSVVGQPAHFQFDNRTDTSILGIGLLTGIESDA